VSLKVWAEDDGVEVQTSINDGIGVDFVSMDIIFILVYCWAYLYLMPKCGVVVNAEAKSIGQGCELYELLTWIF
jgi:hypothetical protein